jgi:PhzF family phenazine biosynthesis protein
MPTRLFQVDAFASRPFTGNPAAVCILSAEASASWMQAVAMEMNLSETAFTWREANGWRLRWFTPVEEVDLCGHATLATSHTLWEQGQVADDQPCVFHTRSGELRATRGKDGAITMDFPAEPAEPCDAPSGLAEALGIEPIAVHRNRFDYLAELPTEDDVRNIAPDMTKLAAMTQRGVMVTALSGAAEFDFVSRFFAPAVGIPEDSVTGSAHCALGPFWSARLNKSVLTGLQASARTGIVGVEIMPNNRVHLRGRAITVLEALLHSDPG